MVDFSSKLRQRREEMRWTQKQLAAKLGKSESYISQLETGVRSPPETIARELARILAADEEEWAFLSGPKQKIQKIHQEFPDQTELFILELHRSTPKKSRKSAYRKLLDAAAAETGKDGHDPRTD